MNSHEYVIFVVVQSLSCVWLFATLRTSAHQASRPSPFPRVCSDSCPLSPWCHPTISFFVTLFSSRLRSFPASGSFPVSQLFASGGQSIGASASVLPVNIQGWFPLGWTSLISFLSKGLWRVFSSTTVQKHQFFGIVAFNQFKYCYHYDRLTVRFFLLKLVFSL